MRRLWMSEWKKLKRSKVISLCTIGGIIGLIIMGFSSMPIDVPNGLREAFILRFSFTVLPYGLLFFPLLTGVLAAFLCRFEHLAGGWRQLMSLPVKKPYVFIVKWLVMISLLGVSQLIFGAGVVAGAYVGPLNGHVEWQSLSVALVLSWLAVWPLAALQLLLSMAWKSFAASFAVNVMAVLPNILIVNSEDFGPFYPWAQPFLAMVFSADLPSFMADRTTLLLVVTVGFITCMAAGIGYTLRKAY
ncbi:ABC transporter permease subunit [Bacillaceae bacterium SIJ1]|uniref:ABC transporter permease n=1 Tax=Litoribacterium kuwaitense TaxID=1398745 RepID=UPI0013ECAEED|nr:ABC transporter permease [Litoribacterium kuwaitense]NGP43864.1 ABC transporter permease subunit [Litoribacterium kuwaitense]